MLLMTYVKADRDEARPLCQHRQHCLRSYWRLAGLGEVDRRKLNLVPALLFLGFWLNVADAADGADGRTGRLCAERPQPNDACPRSPLTTKANFNSQRSKGRLRAAEPARQRSGRSWQASTRTARLIF